LDLQDINSEFSDEKTFQLMKF